MKILIINKTYCVDIYIMVKKTIKLFKRANKKSMVQQGGASAVAKMQDNAKNKNAERFAFHRHDAYGRLGVLACDFLHVDGFISYK